MTGIFRRGGSVVWFLLMVLWLSGGASLAMAQESQGEKKPDGVQQGQPTEPKPTEEKVLKPVEVVAPPIREQAERAETVTIITSEEMGHKHATTLNDLVDMSPGVAVARRSRIGWAGPGAGFRIRGLTNERLIVFVDDVPIMGYNHGHPIPDVHSIDNIDRVEIIHGPASLLYGPNAMGGVINITTIEPPRGWSGYLESSGGSFGTTENIGRTGYGWDKGFALLSGNFRRTDGHRPQSAFDGENFNLKLSQKLDDRFTVSFSAAYDHYVFENPGPVDGTPGRTRQFSGPLGNVTLRGRFDRSETFIALFADQVEFKHTESPRPPVFRDTEWGGRFKESLFLFSGNTLIFGTEVVSFGGTWQNSVTEPVQEDRTTLVSPYLFVEQVLIPAVTVNGGVRFTWTDQFGTDLSPEGGIVVRPFDGTAVRGRVTRGFRVPRVRDVAFAKGVGANPDLEPERLIQYEIGLNQKVGPWATVDVAAFLQDGDNLIQRIPVSPGVTQNQNTGDFTHKGVETRLVVRPLQNLTLRGGVTILDLGKETATVPLNTYDFGGEYTLGDVSIGLSGRYATRLFGSNNKQQRLPNYLVIDTKLSYQLWKGLRAFVEVDNITDENYQEIPGFPQPGIAAFAGLSYKF